MFCSNCGKELADGSMFCNYCGTKQIVKKVCSSCGAELPSDAMFCHVCGEKVVGLVDLKKEINELPLSSFEIEKRGKRTILTKYIGDESDVVIPHGITQIGASAFENCENINSVVIPDSVTHIGDSAFAGCSLKTVSIPESV